MSNNLNIDTMDGYEFESFVGDLLRKMGFDVEHTALSGDGGIDLIAHSHELIFKGKYLIQCKRYAGTIGEPAIRDLYGVVLSQNANKGILMTNSSFTKQAKYFADGKNIELIDGNGLNTLILKYFGNEIALASINENQTTHFTSISGFDNEIYSFLKNRIETDKRNEEAYFGLFTFLYSYIANKELEIMYSGLINECLHLSEEIMKRFGARGNIGKFTKEAFTEINSFLSALLGDIAQAFEITKFANLQKIATYHFGPSFDPERWTDNLFSGLTKETEGYFGTIFLRNFFVIYNYLEFSTGCKYVENLFDEGFTKSLNSCFSSSDFEITNISMEEYKTKLNSIYSGDDKALYIPKSYSIRKDGGFIHYSKDLFINVDQIISKWSTTIDLDKQKQKIQFLMTI